MPNLNRSYSWAIETCNAPRVGYSQKYRNAKTINGITYYDCSSFINYALINGGFETPNYAPTHGAFTTASEGAELIRLGFVDVDPNGDYLPGDIGITPGHTEMCYRGGHGKGVFMGAHTDNAALENQVSIGSSGGNPNYERTFPRLLRYGSGGASGYGSSAYVIAALAGNAWTESHINPTLTQVGGGAFGLFQWDGGRRDNLLKWLSDNGYQPTDPYGQMQYLIIEDDWIGEVGGISSLSEFMSSQSTDVATLTEAFCLCWERPGSPNIVERVEFSNEAVTYIVEHANDTSITEWETLPMYYLTREQALKNAVLMYRFYSAGGGGGGTPGIRIKNMPIWMWIKYHY